ncbi:MAG: tRNA preQ1(34) S-adenosylmethionine ribosyltransferase-isomerase QueA [Deltaproteobacteria bacterium]|nr:tRNA preQ1(34) S-adenosylmethionine ribosyltransferase-isomerase QueA [Deltaproteobacteria bacterium]
MQDDLTLQAYSYELPEENIAQFPADKRDHSRLMVINRTSADIDHLQFSQIRRFIKPADMLVVNDTKVFPARLTGTKKSGGKVEVFLLHYPVELQSDSSLNAACSYTAEALIRSSRRPQPGSEIIISSFCSCFVVEDRGRGTWLITLSLLGGSSLDQLFFDHGAVPLPPYIKRAHGSTPEDKSRYQTVYADQPGAVAAPTAGLHFTEKLLRQLREDGVTIGPITLHVGYGTFAPVQAENIAEHVIHQEYIDIPQQTSEQISAIKKNGGRIWAVGTTTVRALEYAALQNNQLCRFSGWCDLYITPGYRFKIVDNLITNFHLPRSSLLFLVAALCGREKLLDCYLEAIKQGYRFYSYGDAMAITS